MKSLLILIILLVLDLIIGLVFFFLISFLFQMSLKPFFRLGSNCVAN